MLGFRRRTCLSEKFSGLERNHGPMGVKDRDIGDKDACDKDSDMLLSLCYCRYGFHTREENKESRTSGL